MTVTLTSILPAPDAAAPHSAGKNARAALAAVADGNGLSAGQIRIAHENNTVARLQGEISISFSSRIQLDHKPGRQTDATPADSEDAARSEAAARTAALAQNAALRAVIEQELARQPAQGWGCDLLRFNLGRSADDIFCVSEACSACAGTPQEGCTFCAGSGVATKVLTVRYSADISFTLWRQGADVAALQAVEKLGVLKMATDDLADIFIAPLSVDGTRLRAPCVALVPLTTVEFSLEGRFVTAVAAGKAGTIVALDPVLDKFIKPGVTALLKLSRGPLAVDSLVAMAMKYRLVRQTLQALLVSPRQVVYKQLQRDYPIGVSDKYLRAAVKYASAAQESLMAAPRREGLRLGLLAGFIIALGYLAGLRPLIAAPAAALLCDIGVVAALSALCVFIIRKRAAQRIVAITRAPHPPTRLPAMGREGAKAPVLMALVFLLAALCAPTRPPYAQTIAETATAALGPLLSSVVTLQ